MTKYEFFDSGPRSGFGDPLRGLVAALLKRGSLVLAGWAADLTTAPSSPRREPIVEFHAEAGAPEGALYVDGKLVGWIEGVCRL